MSTVLDLLQTALELGLGGALTVLALFLSYLMLGVCDLSTDGCFTLGAVTGAVVALSGHPYLALPAAVLSGVLSGFLTAFLQTRLSVDSLLAGIVMNTGLYSVNIAIMGGSSLLNLNKCDTVFTRMKELVAGSFLAGRYRILVYLLAVTAVAVLLGWFLHTRLGLAIRATGSNPEMVRASSIDPRFTTTVGLCLSGGITALSGCLMTQAQKSVSIDVGNGMVTMALASLLMGRAFIRSEKLNLRLAAAVIGALLFRLIYTLALRLDMPAYMLKLVSAVIVVLAIAGPPLKKKLADRLKKGVRV